jgi:hypothetical protein
VQPPASGTNKARAGSRPARPEELPYTVELWHVDGSPVVERVLARAAHAQLGRAIFKAAQEELPDRRITLRRGSRIVAESSSDTVDRS